MLLSNVTITKEGQHHITGDDKKRGIILDNLFGMFCYFLKSGIFDFLANVFANVTAIKEGRDANILLNVSGMLLSVTMHMSKSSSRLS